MHKPVLVERIATIPSPTKRRIVSIRMLRFNSLAQLLLFVVVNWVDMCTHYHGSLFVHGYVVMTTTTTALTISYGRTVSIQPVSATCHRTSSRDSIHSCYYSYDSSGMVMTPIFSAFRPNIVRRSLELFLNRDGNDDTATKRRRLLLLLLLPQTP